MGEKKRTSILCGLCSGMDIILLDEPSIGVDIDGIEELKKILKIISEKTQTILVISSHDIKFLSEVAQEYIFVFKGKREHVYKGCISDNTIIEHYNKLKGGHNDDAYS